MEPSNFLSQSESILMRWLDINYEIVFKSQSRITNLGADLKNCLHFAAAIHNYSGKSSVKYFNVNKIYRAIIFSSDDGLYLNIYFNSYREFIVACFSSRNTYLFFAGRVDEIRFHLIYHTLISLVENRNRDL